MKYLIRHFFIIIIIALQLISVTGLSQSKSLSDSSNLKLLVAARDIMLDAKTCSLITLDEEGRARARAMDPFIPEQDFTVWFGTTSKSRKVTQIKNDSRVTLYYFDVETEGYVVINGTAMLVSDEVNIKKYWKEEWASFYPNKKENYILIKVIPSWLEVLSSAHGIYNNPTTWQPPVVSFD
jgi:general stress protein 26